MPLTGYGGLRQGLRLEAALVQDAAERTAQASVERGAGAHVRSADITEALDDMLFSGGKLNIALLDGAMAIDA